LAKFLSVHFLPVKAIANFAKKVYNSICIAVWRKITFLPAERAFKINFSDDMSVGKITSIRTTVLETASPYSSRGSADVSAEKSQRDFFDGL